MSLWYDIYINGTLTYEDLQSDDFIFTMDELIIMLEEGTEEIRLEKGDKVEVRCK